MNALHLKGQGADAECSAVLQGLLMRGSDDAIVVLHGLLEVTSDEHVHTCLLYSAGRPVVD